MKRLWIVLASLALMAVFAMPASAVDVKLSGEFYVAGDYYNRTSPNKGYGDASTAFFHQRLRVQTEFIVSPGLSLVTRFDALEKIWGDTSWGGTRGNSYGRPSSGGGDDRAAENIEFHHAYIQYASKVGNFTVGYGEWNPWGTTFGDSYDADAMIRWVLPLQNFFVGALYVKGYEGSTTYKTPGLNRNDNDSNLYAIFGGYTTDRINTGMKVAYMRDASLKGTVVKPGPPPVYGHETNGWLLTPYFIGQFGPVKLQAELEYFRGRTEYDDDWKRTQLRALSAYTEATVDLGPVYFGGLFAYASGIDAAKAPDLSGGGGGKFTGSTSGKAWGGLDFQPTLILWNDNVCRWAGGSITWTGYGMTNAKLFQMYIGAPVKDFDFKLALAYARADEKNTYNWYVANPRGSSYGWELDATATYKITNNLSYMIGAGYLWTGDFFRAKDIPGSKTRNIYVITNKLTLNF